MPRTLLILLFIPAFSFAQKKVNLTLFGGFSNYSGDLQEKRFTLEQSHTGIGAGLSVQLKPKLMLHGTLKKGRVSGDDRFSSRPMNKERNLSFTSNIYEAALTVDYSLFDPDQFKLTPYVFGGGSIFRFNPIAKNLQGREIALRNLNTEGQGFVAGREQYRIITLAVPFGVGVRFRITDNAYLGYEIGLRKTFTDYIDDVSTTYVDEALLLATKGPEAVELAFRGDELKSDLVYPPHNTIRGGSKFKDWYYFSGLTLSVGIVNEEGRLFGRKVGKGSIDCPATIL